MIREVAVTYEIVIISVISGCGCGCGCGCQMSSPGSSAVPLENIECINQAVSVVPRLFNDTYAVSLSINSPPANLSEGKAKKESKESCKNYLGVTDFE